MDLNAKSRIISTIICFSTILAPTNIFAFPTLPIISDTRSMLDTALPEVRGLAERLCREYEFDCRYVSVPYPKLLNELPPGKIRNVEMIIEEAEIRGLAQHLYDWARHWHFDYVVARLMHFEGEHIEKGIANIVDLQERLKMIYGLNRSIVEFPGAVEEIERIVHIANESGLSMSLYDWACSCGMDYVCGRLLHSDYTNTFFPVAQIYQRESELCFCPANAEDIFEEFYRLPGMPNFDRRNKLDEDSKKKIAKDFVDKLRRAKVDLNAPIYLGKTLLYLAARQNCPELISALVNAGADINAKNSGKVATALHVAISYHAVRSVEQLLALGASRTEKDINGNIPLILAIQYGTVSIDILRRLIPDGYNVDNDEKFKNHEGISPIKMCSKYRISENNNRDAYLKVLVRHCPKCKFESYRRVSSGVALPGSISGVCRKETAPLLSSSEPSGAQVFPEDSFLGCVRKAVLDQYAEDRLCVPAKVSKLTEYGQNFDSESAREKF